jgi:phosphoribosylglycinamide formyltransferase-1
MLNPVKIAVFVSGGGTNLQALIDYEKSGGLKHGKISLVLSSNKDAYALIRAEKANIATSVVERKILPQKEFEEKIEAELEKYGAELIVLAGFMSILSADFTEKYDRRIINVHPSLIPSFCGKDFYGLKVHEAALSRGVKVTGATVHFVNEIPDGGEIISQKAVKIRKNDTPRILQKRVMEQAEWIILPRATEKVSREIAKNRK